MSEIYKMVKSKNFRLKFLPEVKKEEVTLL